MACQNLHGCLGHTRWFEWIVIGRSVPFADLFQLRAVHQQSSLPSSTLTSPRPNCMAKRNGGSSLELKSLLSKGVLARSKSWCDTLASGVFHVHELAMHIRLCLRVHACIGVQAHVKPRHACAHARAQVHTTVHTCMYTCTYTRLHCVCMCMVCVRA